MPMADRSFGWRWLVTEFFGGLTNVSRLSWRWLSTEFAGVDEKRLWLTGLGHGHHTFGHE